MYERVSSGPEEMDFLQAYDDYPVIVMQQLEGLGFCDVGGGPEVVRSHSLDHFAGDLRLNTSGGQLSCGQAGAAGGFLGINEAIRPLTHDPVRDIRRAKLGVVGGHGYVDFDRGVCSAAALMGR